MAIKVWLRMIVSAVSLSQCGKFLQSNTNKNSHSPEPDPPLTFGHASALEFVESRYRNEIRNRLSGRSALEPDSRLVLIHEELLAAQLSAVGITGQRNAKAFQMFALSVFADPNSRYLGNRLSLTFGICMQKQLSLDSVCSVQRFRTDIAHERFNGSTRSTQRRSSSGQAWSENARKGNPCWNFAYGAEE